MSGEVGVRPARNRKRRGEEEEPTGCPNRAGENLENSVVGGVTQALEMGERVGKWLQRKKKRDLAWYGYCSPSRRLRP